MFLNSNWTLERYDNDISGHLKIGKYLFGRLSSDRNRFWQAIIWQWTIWRAFKLQSTIWQKIFGQTIKRQRAFLPSWHLVKICLARYFSRWIGQSWTNWQLDKGTCSSKFVFILFLLIILFTTQFYDTLYTFRLTFHCVILWWNICKMSMNKQVRPFWRSLA